MAQRLQGLQAREPEFDSWDLHGRREKPPRNFPSMHARWHCCVAVSSRDENLIHQTLGEVPRGSAAVTQPEMAQSSTELSQQFRVAALCQHG